VGRSLGLEPFFADLKERLAARESALVRLADPAFRPAAVLVPLYLGSDGEPSVVLTRRVDGISHSGQVAFPGGASEPGDANPLETALREAEEEIGIPRRLATPLGQLDDTFVVTGWTITPFVVRIPLPGVDLALTPNPAEVASVFSAPLRALADPVQSRFRFEPRSYMGATHDIPFFEYGGEVIWGATGRVVLQLLEVALGFVAPGRSAP
jgi:8-oxo-dGTP pyrophosphatase MutT (NUDIX family)